MPLSFTGNTSTSATSEALGGLPTILAPFTIVNKSGGNISINVYKITNAGDICITPLNQALSAGQMYQGDGGQIILATQQIKVQVSGNVDYDFPILNLEP